MTVLLNACVKKMTKKAFMDWLTDLNDDGDITCSKYVEHDFREGDTPLLLAYKAGKHFATYNMKTKMANSCLQIG